MDTSSYSLWDEPWICATDTSGHPRKYGLKGILENAGDLICLSNGNRIVDLAILRQCLLPLAEAIKSRYLPDGTCNMIKSEDDAIKRERLYLDEGTFPAAVLEAYGKDWKDRFYLYDAKHPFYQVPSYMVRTINNEPVISQDDAAFTRFSCEVINPKINGSESKEAGYPEVTGDAAKVLTNEEAARALVMYQAFADCSAGKGRRRKNGESLNAKPTPSSRAALWFYQGSTLFKTITLNAPLCDYSKTDSQVLYGSYSPSWEEEPCEDVLVYPYGEEGGPNDLARQYSCISRRAFLSRLDEDTVDGLYALPGDVYGAASNMTEPMFRLQEISQGKIRPVSIRDTGHIWSEIPRFFSAGIVRDYIDAVSEDGIHLKEDKFVFKVAQVFYASTGCKLSIFLQDQIDISTRFLKEKDAARFGEYMSAIDEAAYAIRIFAKSGAEIMSMPDAKKGAAHATAIGDSLQRDYYTKMESIVRSYAEDKADDKALEEAIIERAQKTTDEFTMRFKSSLFATTGTDSRGNRYGNAIAIFAANMKKIRRKYALHDPYEDKRPSDGAESPADDAVGAEDTEDHERGNL